jgi:thiol-disulfide isomerase/thioredoxin
MTELLKSLGGKVKILNLKYIVIAFLLITGFLTPVSEAMTSKAPPPTPNVRALIPTQTLNKGTIDDLLVSKKKFLVIDFWASWCEPCKDSLPFYESTFSEGRYSDFDFVAVGVDEKKADSEAFIQKINFKAHSVWDQNRVFSKSFDIQSLPTMIVLNQEGEILYSKTGFSEKKKKSFLEKLSELQKHSSSKL